MTRVSKPPCPTCGHIDNTYERKIHATLAKALITLYKHSEWPDFTHCPSLPGDTHEISQLEWWGLIEEERTVRPDGGRAGRWRITVEGARFVKGIHKVEKYAVLEPGPILVGHTGPMVDIKDCLGDKFDYRELMGW
jgi:hypothetical protein